MVVPKHIVNRILPPDASVARQVLPTASRRFHLQPRAMPVQAHVRVMTAVVVPAANKLFGKAEG